MKTKITYFSQILSDSAARLCLIGLFGLVVSILAFSGVASADKPSSAHYKVGESHFGAGGSLHDCSGNYCAKTSAGDLTVGHATSDNYSAYLGFNTETRPQLEVIVIGGTQDMGTLKDSNTGTAVFSVKVRTYLSSGYSLMLMGNTPSQGSHHLDNLAVPSASSQGTEQFGVNLVANTTPNIGQNPAQVPSNAFSYGTVATGYDSPNDFSYNSGDVVAGSSSSTGQTDYTLSMIANISPVTPAGRYNGSFTAVATSTF